MEKGEGAHRLPSGDQWPLLRGAVLVGEAPSPSAADCEDRRVLPRQPARGQPSVLAAQRPPHHPNRGHAQKSPRKCQKESATRGLKVVSMR